MVIFMVFFEHVRGIVKRSIGHNKNMLLGASFGQSFFHLLKLFAGDVHGFIEQLLTASESSNVRL